MRVLILLALAGLCGACGAGPVAGDSGAAPGSAGDSGATLTPGSEVSTAPPPVSVGNIGDACQGSGDCKDFNGVPALCMKASEGYEMSPTWPGGYCTFGCDHEDPKCPPGSVCSDGSRLTETGDRCLRPCGADADCRTGYVCEKGLCVPPLGCDVTCEGCCDAQGNCLPGTSDTACGNWGEECRACGTFEACTYEYLYACTCANDCEDGCCDPSTGACLPGTSSSACGTYNSTCWVCGANRVCVLTNGNYSCEAK